MISPGGRVPLLADSGPLLRLSEGGTRMPAERTTMRQVREVLRLKFVGGVPTREIARRIGVAASTVRTTISRFQAAGLSWPLPDELTDAALEARLFPDAGTKQGHRRQVEPDWAGIHRELKRKHVTLSILWDEYTARDPEGYRWEHSAVKLPDFRATSRHLDFIRSDCGNAL
jgi:transposase-like protein